tara:strand:- start:1279 stop:2256 length:978 start_codon:yes stop_codon:yes gene_type:complete
MNSSILKSKATEVAVSCPVCGHDQWSVVYQKGTQYNDDVELVPVISNVCHECFVVFTSPRLSAAELRRFYFSEQGDWHDVVQQVEDSESNPMTTLRMQRVSQFLFCGAEILEVGGGNMNFATNLARIRSDITVTCIDPSIPEDVVLADNLRLKKTYLVDNVQNTANASYDIVIAHHVLEHQSEPGKFLDSIRTMLKSDGVVVIEVPNLMAPFWSLPVIDRFLRTVHLVNYHYAALRRLLETHGFSIISHDAEAVHSIGVVGKRSIPLRSRAPSAGFSKVVKRLGIYLYFFCWRGYSFLYRFPMLKPLSYHYSRLINRCTRRYFSI